MNIAMFEDEGVQRLLPLVWLRAACELCCGRDRLLDKVRTHFGPTVARLYLRPLLREVVAQRVALDAPSTADDWCLLNARALVMRSVPLPLPGVAWRLDGQLVAVGVPARDIDAVRYELFQDPDQLDSWLRPFRFEECPDAVGLMDYPWELPLFNEDELRRQLRGGGMHAGRVYPGAHLIQPAQITIAPGASVKPGAVLDAEDGPIHIDADATVDSNAVLQGPCYVGPQSLVRAGALLCPGTTIGPVCKVGGEIKKTIFHGYANKQHDGFMGHSYVASWVNLGADTVTSDLKNTYGTIRVNLNGVGTETGLHFVGAFIGDHAKTGIGTILPTGGIVGIAANVFTRGPVPKFVPSFAWLSDAGLSECRIDKALQIARTVMDRRDIELSDLEETLLRQVAEEARTVEAAGWR